VLIKDVFADAIEHDEVELQAIIIYATQESKECSMNDEAKKLNDYFAKENREEMKPKINAIMDKLQMKRFRGVYEVFTSGEVFYIYADTKEEAMYLKRSIGARLLLHTDLINYNGKNRTVKELIKGKKTPHIIGGSKL